MRKLSHRLHLWLGLVAAAFLLVEGVTGAIMAWGPELIQMSNPVQRQPEPSYRVDATAPRLPLATLTAKLEESRAPLRLRVMHFASKPGEAWVADLDTPTGTTAHVWFDPSTAQVLGTRSTTMQHAWLARFVRWAGRYHGDFPAAVALLAIAASGLILWWPRRFLFVRRPLSLARTNLELHAAIGFYTSLLLFVFASTGVIMGEQRLALRVASWVTHTPIPPPIVQEKRALAHLSAPLDLDQAFALATANRPEGSFVAWQRVNELNDLVAFQYRTPDLAGRIMVDRSTGRVREFFERRNLTAPERFVRQWVRQVHEGTIYGAVSHWIAGACGLLLAVLAITGPAIWYFRRRIKDNAAGTSQT